MDHLQRRQEGHLPMWTRLKLDACACFYILEARVEGRHQSLTGLRQFRDEPEDRFRVAILETLGQAVNQ